MEGRPAADNSLTHLAEGKKAVLRTGWCHVSHNHEEGRSIDDESSRQNIGGRQSGFFVGVLLGAGSEGGRSRGRVDRGNLTLHSFCRTAEQACRVG
jgi:hypothetical protein